MGVFFFLCFDFFVVVLIFHTQRVTPPPHCGAFKDTDRDSEAAHLQSSHLHRSGPEIMHPEKHLPELMAEKNSLDPSFVHAVRLIAEGKAGEEGLFWFVSRAP